jgi:hypothetical protein
LGKEEMSVSGSKLVSVSDKAELSSAEWATPTPRSKDNEAARAGSSGIVISIDDEEVSVNNIIFILLVFLVFLGELSK